MYYCLILGAICVETLQKRSEYTEYIYLNFKKLKRYREDDTILWNDNIGVLFQGVNRSRIIYCVDVNVKRACSAGSDMRK